MSAGAAAPNVMSMPKNSPDLPMPLRVVIAGGGIAALEATLALRDLAGDRVVVTILAPETQFVYRPMTVREPFAYGAAQRQDLAALVDDMGATLVTDRFAWVDPVQRLAHTDGGLALHYDALILAVGARRHERHPHALTIDDRNLDDCLHGLVQDIEGGYVHSLAFVVPGSTAWPLPIYELALMSAQRAFDTSAQLDITIVTPEDAPLAIFGLGASAGMAALLAEAGIEVITSAYTEIPQSNRIVVTPGHRGLSFDRIVALPELVGSAIRGLPADGHGFLAVDPYGHVRGVDRVFAAGDATDFAIKHGGVAAQQADTVAQSIAALAGADVRPQPFRPEIHGLVLTGGAPRYLSATLVGGHGFSSQISDTPTWSPPTKVAAKYLAPYLAQRAPQLVASP
jgi:sulfide:quinone oxidoreductase